MSLSNDFPTITLSPCKTTLVRPEDEYNLKEIKKYIVQKLEEGINPAIHNAILINKKELRISQNVFMILDKILNLLPCEDEGIYNISDEFKKVSQKKKSHTTLISLLGQEKERYRDNPNLLLKDLEVYNAYYGIIETIDIGRDQIITEVNTEVNEVLQEAYVVAIKRTKLSKEETHKIPKVTEFKIVTIGNTVLIQHSDSARESTKNIKGLRDRIQEIYEELMTTKG